MSVTSYDLLFVLSDKEVLGLLETYAQKNSYSYLTANDKQRALDCLKQNQFRVVVMAQDFDSLSGIEVLQWLQENAPSSQVILVADQPSLASAVQAFKLGACDYWTLPFDDTNRVYQDLDQALQKNSPIGFSDKPTSSDDPGVKFKMIGKSPKMKALFSLLEQVAPTSSHVLIQGESGTGKELIARALHEHSLRQDHPFVVINCAAMPENLLESELFGYVKGAFTGASADKMGLFEVAKQGTVFLDEIGEVPLSVQVKLLRAIQEGEIRRLGDTQSISIDVRLVAATNKNLPDQVARGEFREDLYYRLNVVNIHAPALKERIEDVVLLAYHFLKQKAEGVNARVDKISLDALQALQAYHWPGNVRELENTIERAMVLAKDDTVTAKNLSPAILSASFYKTPNEDEDQGPSAYQEAKKRALSIFNRSYIISLLQKTRGNITQASEMAGMDRSNFKKIIRKYKVDTKNITK